jgi:hypothetical protein
MAEQPFWIIATIIIIIVVAVALLTLFGGQVNPFGGWLSKERIHSRLCQELAAKGCINTYLPRLKEMESNIFYDEIGRPLRNRYMRDAKENRAKFGEVCEYLGFRDFDECLKNCNCLSYGSGSASRSGPSPVGSRSGPSPVGSRSGPSPV